MDSDRSSSETASRSSEESSSGPHESPKNTQTVSSTTSDFRVFASSTKEQVSRFLYQFLKKNYVTSSVEFHSSGRALFTVSRDGLSYFFDPPLSEDVAHQLYEAIHHPKFDEAALF